MRRGIGVGRMGGAGNVEGVKRRFSEGVDREEERRRKRVREARRRGRRKVEGCSVYFVMRGERERWEGIGVEELCGFFEKCGVLDVGVDGGKRVRLYWDEEGRWKGDGVVTYAHEAAVDNAVLILGDSEIVPGVRVEMGRAEFDKLEGKSGGDGKGGGGEVVGVGKKKSGVGEQMKVKLKLGWDEDGEGLLGRGVKLVKIVILKNVFDRNDVEGSEEEMYRRIQEDMEEGCGKIGKVENVTVFKRNEDGAVAVKFRRPTDALKCVERMNGRWYDRRQLKAEIWDGITDYRWRENEEDRNTRLKEWENWLGNEEGDETKRDGGAKRDEVVKVENDRQ